MKPRRFQCWAKRPASKHKDLFVFFASAHSQVETRNLWILIRFIKAAKSCVVSTFPPWSSKVSNQSIVMSINCVFFPVLCFKERNQPVAICQPASLQCNPEHRQPCVVSDLCYANIHCQTANKHCDPCRWTWDGSSTVSPLFHLYTTWVLRWRLCSGSETLACLLPPPRHARSHCARNQ